MSSDTYLKFKRSTFTGSLCGTGPVVQCVWVHVLIQADWATGVVEINPILTAAAIGGGVTAEEVESAIAMFCEPDPKSRTKDFEGRRLERIKEFSYKILNWHTHQRGPDPDLRRQQIREAVARYRGRQKQRDVQDKSSPVLDSPQGSKKKPRKPPEEDPDFEVFYLAYPKKVKKADAQKAWGQKNGERPPLSALLAKLEEHKRSWTDRQTDRQYIPNPATWLRNEQWNDDLKAVDPLASFNETFDRLAGGQDGD